MRSYRYILSISALVLALAYTLWFVFAGFGNHQDPLYWLYKYEHLEGGWMAVGTLLTGGAIVKIFGAQLLPLRLFGWLCTTTAIALPYGCLLTKEQRRENLHWLALTYLFMGYGAFQEFSPGTLSVLLLSALWVTSVRDDSLRSASGNVSPACEVSTPAKTFFCGWGTQKHECGAACFLRSNLRASLPAILLGLAVAARFPNILTLLILIPLWRKRSLWLIPIAAATTAIVYLLGICLITPAVTDAAMGSHDLWAMLTKLWEKGGLLIGMLFISVGVLAIGEVVVRYQRSMYSLKNVAERVGDAEHEYGAVRFLRSSIRALPTGLLIGLIVGYFVAYATKPFQWYNINLTYLVSALCLVIALRQFSIFHFQFSIGAALLIVATLGTDTAWLKLFPAVLCLLPVAAVHYEESMRRYLCGVLAVLAVIVMVRMTTNSVGQSNLTQVNTISSVSPYKGIAIRDIEEQRMNQYIADYDSLQSTISNIQCPILSVGQDMLLMRAVTGCEAAKFNEFWSNIFDSVYTDKYCDIIVEERPIVFCSFSPQFKTKKTYKDKESRMEQMLLEEGYTPLDRSKQKYMIYIP